MKKVNILGTIYTVEYVNFKEDEEMKERSLQGYCDEIEKKVVIAKYNTLPGCEKDSKERCLKGEKSTLKHELIHAFFNESGLSTSANQFDGAWAKNEEMVDWIAIQSSKIFKVFKDLDLI